MDKEIQTQFEADLIAFANKHSLTRVKTESMNFDTDYRRGDDGSFRLVVLKAVIRVLGKTSKVPIGEGHEHADYRSAYKAVKAYWSAYFKERRDKRTDAARRAEARRQKAYRERRKEREAQFQRQQ